MVVEFTVDLIQLILQPI